jgi:hypothetical protein
VAHPFKSFLWNCLLNPSQELHNENFEEMVPIVMDSSTCHQDPDEYGYMSAASIVSGVAVSPTNYMLASGVGVTTHIDDVEMSPPHE